jgi:hypothetical protein
VAVVAVTLLVAEELEDILHPFQQDPQPQLLFVEIQPILL